MLAGLELKVFLALCKVVRQEQESRTRLNKTQEETYGKELAEGVAFKTSMYIKVHPDNVYGQVAEVNGMKRMQVFAILHRLHEQGYVKYTSGSGKRRSVVALDHKGVNLVKQLKKK
jgi:hypothetical protein